MFLFTQSNLSTFVNFRLSFCCYENRAAFLKVAIRKSRSLFVRDLVRWWKRLQSGRAEDWHRLFLRNVGINRRHCTPPKLRPTSAGKLFFLQKPLPLQVSSLVISKENRNFTATNEYVNLITPSFGFLQQTAAITAGWVQRPCRQMIVELFELCKVLSGPRGVFPLPSHARSHEWTI